MKKGFTEEEKEIEKKIKNISNGYFVFLGSLILCFIAVKPESIILVGLFIFSPFSIIALFVIIVLANIVHSIAEATYKYYDTYQAIAYFTVFIFIILIIQLIARWSGFFP